MRRLSLREPPRRETMEALQRGWGEAQRRHSLDAFQRVWAESRREAEPPREWAEAVVEREAMESQRDVYSTRDTWRETPLTSDRRNSVSKRPSVPRLNLNSMKSTSVKSWNRSWR